MTFFQAVILGAAQGITEFLPVSSSAHVTFASQLLGVPPDRIFCIFLDAGSLLSIFVFFRREMLNLILGAADWICRKKTENYKFFATVSLASLPVLIIFEMWDYFVDVDIHSRIILSGSLILFGVVLYLCDRNPTDKTVVTRKDALKVGFVQPLSIIPGVSRLGICLSMMRYLKYSREESFRFAMILSVPPVVGACFVEMVKIVFVGETKIQDWSLALTGFLSAFVFGLVSLSLVLKFLRNCTLTPIIVYRVSIGLTMLTQELAKIFRLL
jgi:undecaprenyl-diphosphatase